MAETVLAKMAVVIAANTAAFGRSLQTAQTQLKDFATGAQKIGVTLAGLFAIKEIAAFTFEVSKLAGEADGVQAAFDKLPNATRLMLDLKEATGGTVSELDLMKRAVQASNFGISMESLPKLLEFAAVRAQQTGQSVDYLVDSIVTGIGRKSPLILDNLGISAVALKDKMNGVAIATADVGQVADAVGKIAGDSLVSMGKLAETTAIQTQQVSAAWDDTKVAIGRAVNSTGLFQAALNGITKSMNLIVALSDETRDGDFSLLAAGIKSGDDRALKSVINNYMLLRNELGKPLPEANLPEIIKKYGLSEEQGKRFLTVVREINGELDKTPATKIDPVPVKAVTTLETLQEKVKELNQAFEQTDVNDKKRLQNYGVEIIAIGKQIEELEKLRKARKDASFTPDTIDDYRNKLSNLNEELEKTNVNDIERIRVLSAQISGYTKAIERVEALKNSFADLDGLAIKTPDLSNLINIDMDKVTERFNKSMEEFQRNFRAKGEQIKQTAVDIGGALSANISNALVGIGEALGGAIAGTENFGDAILKVVAGFAKQLGEILIATGVAMLAAKTLISNPYTAIIAGVALVALASAASASISKAHAGSFGGSGGGGAATGSSSVSSFSRDTSAQQIILAGEFKLRGKDLALAIDKERVTQQRTG